MMEDKGAALVPSALSVRQASYAMRNRVFHTADDNIDRAVASAIYRQQNSEIARCFLRLIAAHGKADTPHPNQDTPHE